MAHVIKVADLFSFACGILEDNCLEGAQQLALLLLAGVPDQE